MQSNKDLFMDERERQHTEEVQEQHYVPAILEITPGYIISISKSNVETFHRTMRDMIYQTGSGVFEYLETIKFFEKLKEEIFGSQSKDGDKGFKNHVIDEIRKYGKEYITSRGVKFELAETGTKYDFSGDPVWSSIVEKIKPLDEDKKKREAFLKSLTKTLIETDPETGETFEVQPPIKTSTSSFKVTLGK